MEALKGPYGQSATMSSDFQNVRYINAELGAGDDGVDRGHKAIATVRYQENMSQDENLAIADLLRAAPELRDLLSKMADEVRKVEGNHSLPELTKLADEASDFLSKVNRFVPPEPQQTKSLSLETY